jgi:hypothetical protein
LELKSKGSLFPLIKKRERKTISSFSSPIYTVLVVVLSQTNHLCCTATIAEWLLLEKANVNGGFRVYNLLSLVSYPKRVHVTSLMLTAKYWGSRRHMPLSKTITWIASY